MSAQNGDVGNRTEFNVASETVTQHRDPPPPYTPSNTNNEQTIIHQTIIVQAPLRNTPTFFSCPRCQERVLTKVQYENSSNTHMLAGFICGLTFWCMLCCLSAIPYYVTTFKKANHFCPNCNTLLGTYSKI